MKPITREEYKFLLRSIVHFGAGIYLLILSVVFIVVIQYGSATIHLDFGTPFDLFITLFCSISSITFIFMEYQELSKK